MNILLSLCATVTRRARPGAMLVLCSLAVAVPAVSRADPPCWAPAHGYRAKNHDRGCDKQHHKSHKSKYKHDDYAGDYRQPAPEASAQPEDAISAGGLIGAAVGGYAGSHVGKGSGRLAATAGGAVAGYVVGQEIERDLSAPSR
jgi:hypothetical protein